jgi:hypothetical protein
MTLDHGIGIRIPASQPPIIEEEERFILSKGWAEMIRKEYEVDRFVVKWFRTLLLIS